MLRTTTDPDTRVEAVTLVAAIGYRPAAADIAALASRFDDDFALAYRAAEALGQIGSTAERPLLAKLARDHWHPAVRAMAERALHNLDNGSFERFPGDLAPSRDAAANMLRSIDVGTFRYATDPEPRWCTRANREAAQGFPQSELPEIAPPKSGDLYLKRLPVPPDVIRRVTDRDGAYGAKRIIVAAPWNDGWIVGSDIGEFGGSLAFRRNSTWQTLIDDNVHMAFRWGGRLYVLTGLAHLSLDEGTLWELDPGTLNVRRRIRLPQTPAGIAVSSRGVLVVRTGRGDLGIARNGRLVDPGAYSDCIQ